MTRLALELKGDTHEYTISGESVYLGTLGRAGMSAFSEIASGRQGAAELLAKLAGFRAPDEFRVRMADFMRRGIEIAVAHAGDPWASDDGRRDAIRTMAALEDETFEAAPPLPLQQSLEDTCRHGRRFSDRCAECGE